MKKPVWIDKNQASPIPAATKPPIEDLIIRKPVEARPYPKEIVWYVSHLGSGRKQVIDEQGLVIGKSERADFQIKNPTISRLHARLWLEEDGVYLEDLNSSNHTYIDQELVLLRGPLEDGTKFQCSGDELFTVFKEEE